MRLLHLHSGNLYGGIETMLTTIAQAAVEDDRVDVRFALCFERRLHDELRTSGRVEVLGPARLSRPRSVLRVRDALRTLLRRLTPDAVVMHGPWAQVVFGPVLAHQQVAFVLFAHGPLSGPLQWRARRWRPSAIACNSACTRDRLPEAYRGIPARVVHCPVPPPPGIPAEERARIRQSFGAAAGEVVILQASRMERWKGQETHLRALGLLKDLPGWTAWIAGGAQRPRERAYEAELTALAATCGISSRVRFLGEQRAMASLMASADIYCQPNTEPEPFGIACVEALWGGLPVVASGIGGGLEIITPETGVLVAPNDAEGLALALRELITSRERRVTLGTHGPARAAQLCDVRRQVDGLHRFIAASIFSRPARKPALPA